MVFISESASALLDYWHEGQWRCNFNHLPLSETISSDLLFAPLNEIAKTKSGLVWVAPIVFQNVNQEKWIPLWLPAQSEQGVLKLRETPTLPWIPLSQFKSSVHDFNEWCLNEFYNEDRTCAFKTWDAFYVASIALLDQLSEGEWQVQLQAKGFVRLEQAAFFEQGKNDLIINPLLQRYIQIDDVEPNVVLEDELIKENAHLFCGMDPNHNALSNNDYEIVIQALTLPKGSLLAIETPWGSNKESVLEAIVASKQIYALAHGHEVPKVYRLARVGTNLSLLEHIFSKHPDQELIVHTYQDMVSGINLAERLLSAKEKEQTIDEEIALLQTQDEAAEKQVEILLAQQRDSRKVRKTLKQRWQELFNAKACPLSDNIRQLKVQRTKLHRQLVEAVEEKVAYRQAQQYWNEWCSAQKIPINNPHDYSEHVKLAQQIMACRLLSLTGSCWRSVSHIHEGAELLIIENANQLRPQQIFSFLSKVKVAIFMGNPQNFRFEEVVDAITDEQLLAGYPCLDEETYEQLQYKGMLLTTGSALTVALANSSIQSYTEYGEWRANCMLYEIEPRHPELVKFCNLFHSSKLVANSTLIKLDSELGGVNFLPVNGHSHPQGLERVNPMEVKAIQNWIEKNLVLLENKTIVVITLYQSQADLVKQVFKEIGLNVEVYSIYDLPDKCWDYVVFSSALTARDPRPYLFDQNDTFFYSLIARAQLGAWVVGDSALFNPKMHSPSGKLAKFLAHKESFAVQVAS